MSAADRDVMSDQACQARPSLLGDRIDMLCDAFERAWLQGGEPTMEEYLGDASAFQRPLLLEELLALEVEYRRRRGEEPAAAEYLARFPDCPDIVRRALTTQTSAVPAINALPCDTASSLRTLLLDPDVAATSLDSPQFPWAARRLLHSHMVERSFDRGEALLRQGDPGDSLIVIQSGTVEVVTRKASGPPLRVGRCGPGEIVGEMALLTHEPRTADVLALEPVRALVLPAACFHRVAHMFPAVAVLLTQLIAQRLGHRRRDVLAGKTLDRYRIKHRLGRGGMSVVYLAEGEGGRVALKMMSHRLVYDQAARELFQREAQIIEAFDHPHIVRTYGRFAAFHTEFLVLELCRGVTLRERIRRDGPVREVEFRALSAQLAAALDYAHGRGIVHRDVKPSNVMVDGGDLKLMDFGLAQPLVAAADHGGTIAGTPRYMAPEQLTGGAVTAAADWFAAGCVMFELLTAVPLLDMDDLAELRRWHADPSAQDVAGRLRALRPGLPAEITEVVAGALAPRPHDRWPAVAALRRPFFSGCRTPPRGRTA